MTRLARFLLILVAGVALSGAPALAQGAGAAQKPPDAAAKPADQAQAKDAKDAQAAKDKPADAPKAPELTEEQKAFNAVAEEKDAQKRVPLYEKFIADYPKSSLVSMARSQIQSATVAALKTSATKYQDYVKTEIETAKKSSNAMQLPSTYQRFASELLSAGVMLAEAEEYSRQAVSLLDEKKYIENARKQEQEMLDAFNKRMANPPAPSAAPASGGVTFRSLNGAPTVALTPPRPAPATPPRPPTAPTPSSEQTLRNNFNGQRATYLATLGQLLMKRDKAAEGEKVLKQAYDLKPSPATLATIARLLSESAKKAGDTKAQFEYLTTLALSGRITAAEQKEFEEAYKTSHNGSLAGLDAMLDEKYRADNKPFAVTPVNRKPTPNQKVVLTENFSGAG